MGSVPLHASACAAARRAHQQCISQELCEPTPSASCKTRLDHPYARYHPAIARMRARMRVAPLPLPLFLTLDITTRPHPRMSLAVSTVHSAAAGKFQGAPAHLAALSHCEILCRGAGVPSSAWPSAHLFQTVPRLPALGAPAQQPGGWAAALSAAPPFTPLWAGSSSVRLQASGCRGTRPAGEGKGAQAAFLGRGNKASGKISLPIRANVRRYLLYRRPLEG